MIGRTGGGGGYSGGWVGENNARKPPAPAAHLFRTSETQFNTMISHGYCYIGGFPFARCRRVRRLSPVTQHRGGWAIAPGTYGERCDLSGL